MFSARNKAISAAVVAALVSSSVATASTPAPVAATPTAQSSWMALSMLTPAGTVGLGGAAVQANSDDRAPPPPPPEGYAGPGFPPLPVIAILLADVALAIYIATKHHNGRVVLPTPNSAT